MRELTEKEKEFARKYVPIEFKVLLIVDEVDGRTESGLLFKPDTARDRQQVSQDRGRILGLGGSAFGHFKDPMPKIGDRVLMNKHAGYRFSHREKVDGSPRTDYDLRIVNDKDINMILMEEDNG